MWEACGRVAAQDVQAHRAIPHFRRAAMDGYVCHDADVADASPSRPVRLRVTGVVRTGDVPGPGPAPGEAWAITTGAPLPRRGDRVVPLESGRLDKGDLIVDRSPGPKRHVAEPGEDVPEGTVLVTRGTVVTAAAAAALAAAGIPTLRVFRRPRVALVATGTELVEVHEARWPLPAGRTINSNAVALQGELVQAGCHVDYRGIVADDREVLRRVFESLAPHYDVVLTTGGVSVGRSDLVHRAWLDLGASRVLGRVDLKPGGPFFAGRLGPLWGVGLSGTPVACLAAFHLLVRPLLRRLGGARYAVRPQCPALLRTPLPHATDRMRALWARVVERGNGPPEVEILTLSVPGTMVGVLQADAVALVPPGSPPLPVGSQVTVLLLRAPEDREGLEVRPPRPGPLALAVVGESGSGKTTVVAGLALRLAREGIRVATVKHAAHGFVLDRPGSDSDRMAYAGAGAVVLAGPEETAIRLPGAAVDPDRAVRLALETAAAAGAPLPEVVIVEGFSCSTLPRIRVGPPKAPADALIPAWAVLPRVGEVSPDELECELDRAAALVRAHLRGVRGEASAAPRRSRQV